MTILDRREQKEAQSDSTAAIARTATDVEKGLEVQGETTSVGSVGAGVAGFVALSKFVIANGMMEEVKNAFRHRPHLVDDASGFVRMEVMVPFDNPDELWLVTYWADEESYRVWHRSHEYHESHKGIPKGLKLVPRSAEIRLFEFICS